IVDMTAPPVTTNGSNALNASIVGAGTIGVNGAVINASTTGAGGPTGLTVNSTAGAGAGGFTRGASITANGTTSTGSVRGLDVTATGTTTIGGGGIDGALIQATNAGDRTTRGAVITTNRTGGGNQSLT